MCICSCETTAQGEAGAGWGGVAGMHGMAWLLACKTTEDIRYPYPLRLSPSLQVRSHPVPPCFPFSDNSILTRPVNPILSNP